MPLPSPQNLALVVGLAAAACTGAAGPPAPQGSDDKPTEPGPPSSGAASGSVGSGTAGTGGQTPAGTGGHLASGGSGTGGRSPGPACTNARPTGTEWDEATCDQWATETSECGNAWMIDGNYCNESCGRCDSSRTGGFSGAGSGSSGGGVAPSGCTSPEAAVCDNQSGQHCGYTYEYWKDQGSGCLTNKADGFSVEWNNVNNLLGRKGRRPGSRTQIVDYQANYQPGGSSYLCVYGWTRNPLVEYYIVDSWGSWRPPGEAPMATVNSDGGTYEIYRTQRVNAPSIDGNQTFYQYWSVRTERRTSGTITVGNHFNAWERAGLRLGTLHEVSMTVEGYQSSGTADVLMSMR